MHVGLFFGSFNPIHNGHICIGEFMHTHYSMDEIWYVLSPQNPLKEKKNLLHESQRLQMLEAAIKPYHYMKVSIIEFDLPKPSYTYFTLRELLKTHSGISFSLIMGNDAMENIDKWKNYTEILENYTIYLYPRKDCKLMIDRSNIIQTKAPIKTISSSEIRDKIQKGESVQTLLPNTVFNIIQSEKYYR